MSPNDTALQSLQFRFGDGEPAPTHETAIDPRVASRGSVRKFTPERLEPALIRTLCAAALCAPSKSDLQGRDIIIVEDAALLARLKSMLTEGPLGQAWIADAPHLLIFCANHRRQRLWHTWHDVPFANDHLDAFFNAAVDAGIALSAFVTAAERVGLGTCPISAIRNHAQAVSDLLGLPQHVFPVAGLGLGWPSETPRLSLRLPLDVTVHTDRYTEMNLRERVEGYDRRRQSVQPYRQQRGADVFGPNAAYGWSLDKARQYSTPERADFGHFVRTKGFNLE